MSLAARSSLARRTYRHRLRPRLARLLTPLRDMPPAYRADAPLRQAEAILALDYLRDLARQP